MSNGMVIIYYAYQVCVRVLFKYISNGSLIRAQIQVWVSIHVFNLNLSIGVGPVTWTQFASRFKYNTITY